MLRLIAFILALFISATSPSANAANFSGNYLLHVCAMNEDGSEVVQGGHTACQGYIAGMIDYHNVLRGLGTAPSIDFCIPEGEDLYAIQKNVYRYFYYKRDQHGEFVASPGIGLALSNFYPCK